jgi:hypothetical protein
MPMTPEDIGFSPTEDPLKYVMEGYSIWFEGYAWVLYKIWKDKEVPLSETHNLQDFKTIIDLLEKRVGDE